MDGKGLTISFFLFVLTSTFPFGKSFNFSNLVLISNSDMSNQTLNSIYSEKLKNEKQLKIRKENYAQITRNFISSRWWSRPFRIMHGWMHFMLAYSCRMPYRGWIYLLRSSTDCLGCNTCIIGMRCAIHDMQCPMFRINGSSIFLVNEWPIQLESCNFQIHFFPNDYSNPIFSRKN